MANKLPLNATETKVLTITGKRLLTRIEHELPIVGDGNDLKMFNVLNVQSSWDWRSTMY